MENRNTRDYRVHIGKERFRGTLEDIRICVHMSCVDRHDAEKTGSLLYKRQGASAARRLRASLQRTQSLNMLRFRT